jgi:hypothetical protein
MHIAQHRDCIETVFDETVSSSAYLAGELPAICLPLRSAKIRIVEIQEAPK